MPKGLVNESSLNSIGTAINVLNGTEGTYLPSEMGEAIIDAIPTETASGNPIHITDAAACPAESVVTTLEPVQEGSGDPSPDNVRPITGHTGVELKHSGADTSIYETHSITFPQEQSPVYGGEVDWVNGVLRVTEANVDLGTLNWGLTSRGLFAGTVTGIKRASSDTELANIKCSIYKTDTSSNIWYIRVDKAICVAVNANDIWVVDSSYSSVPSFKTAMSGVQLVYELATPLEIPLTPEIITLLKGENNVWTDAGTSEIEYKVDLNSYIQKLIDEASTNASVLSVSPLSLSKSVSEPESETEEIKEAYAKSADEVVEEAEKLTVEDVKDVDVAEENTQGGDTV